MRGVEAKHATRQVDQLLSNLGVDLDVFQARWVEFMLSELSAAWVNLDWTDADADDQTTLVASSQGDRGRSAPLMWVTVRKSELKDKRFAHVDTLLTRLRAGGACADAKGVHRALPPGAFREDPSRSSVP